MNQPVEWKVKRFWWWLNCLLRMCWIMHWVMFSQEQNRRERLMRGWWNDECHLFCLPEMVNNSRPYQRRKQVCFINFLFNTYSNGWGQGDYFWLFHILPVEGWAVYPPLFSRVQDAPNPLKLGSSHPSTFCNSPRPWRKIANLIPHTARTAWPAPAPTHPLSPEILSTYLRAHQGHDPCYENVVPVTWYLCQIKMQKEKKGYINLQEVPSAPWRDLTNFGKGGILGRVGRVVNNNGWYGMIFTYIFFIHIYLYIYIFCLKSWVTCGMSGLGCWALFKVDFFLRIAPW